MDDRAEILKESISCVFSSAANAKDTKNLVAILLDTECRTTAENQFLKQFVQCLKPVLMKPKASTEARRILLFVARFSGKLYESYCVENNITQDSSGYDMHPLIDGVIDFLIEAFQAVDSSVRFHACFLLEHMMKEMLSQRYLNDPLCERFTVPLMEHVLDRSSSVRAQACDGIHYFQNEFDPDCKFTKELLFLMKRDLAATVRQRILSQLPVTCTTIPDILLRLRDVSSVVRLKACTILAKTSVHTLSLEQRQVLIQRTLHDEHEPVRKLSIEIILPGWLKQTDGSVLLLLCLLGVDKCPKLAELVLDTLFSTLPLDKVTQSLVDIQQDRMVCVTKLSTAAAIYWHLVAKHLNRKKMTDELEGIVPELTDFTQYIHRCFLAPETVAIRGSWSQETQQAILWNLLQIVALYDLADEYGRLKLKSLTKDLLPLPFVSGEQLVTFICQLLHSVQPNSDHQVAVIDNVIRSLHPPLPPLHSTTISAIFRLFMGVATCDQKIAALQLKTPSQDPTEKKTMDDKIHALATERRQILQEAPAAMDASHLNQDVLTKCLDLVYGLAQTLRREVPVEVVRLLHSYVRPVFWVTNPQISIAAVRALTACCLLDVSLAKKHWNEFLKFMLLREPNEVILTALKALFDMMLVHKIETFHIDPEYDETAESDNISTFAGHLEVDQSRRLVAAEGLWKLLMAQRLKSPALVSRLIVLYYNPVTENDPHLRQLLSILMHKFATEKEWAPEMLQQAFLRTLRVFFTAPPTSTLATVQVSKVAELLVSLTSPGMNMLSQKNVHNELAKSLCKEALIAEHQEDIEVIMRTLLSLKLDLVGQQELQQNLNQLTEALVQRLVDTRLHRVAVVVQNKIKETFQ